MSGYTVSIVQEDGRRLDVKARNKDEVISALSHYITMTMNDAVEVVKE